ncbi:type II toxin-antitoxin system VapC family toxin [Candidatus Woesearchaeota archaeon]|nr:type II toxin-antitoxin system VapC family toxin [Candidatus Woesearchaeota archaeon]
MIGLDTSAIIDLFRGKPEIKGFFESNKEPLAATIVSYLELFFGLNPSDPKHGAEGECYRKFFEGIYNISLTHQACEEASRIFWNLKKEGRIIEQYDCLIGALLIKNGITKILTKNPKHFGRIKGLTVLTY